MVALFYRVQIRHAIIIFSILTNNNDLTIAANYQQYDWSFIWTLREPTMVIAV